MFRNLKLRCQIDPEVPGSRGADRMKAPEWSLGLTDLDMDGNRRQPTATSCIPGKIAQENSSYKVVPYA